MSIDAGNDLPRGARLAGPAGPKMLTDAGGPVRAAYPDDAFARLVALFQGNEFLLGELGRLRLRRDRARDYARRPGSNQALARACLLQLSARHSAVLNMLRANRVEARHLAGGVAWSDRESA